MPFQPFTPPAEPESSRELVPVRRVHHAVTREPITRASQLHNEPAAANHPDLIYYESLSKWQHLRSDWGAVPTWIKVMLYLAVFIAFWWVSMPFRGLMIVLGIFWFFAFGAHPVTHIGRTAHDILDGDD